MKENKDIQIEILFSMRRTGHIGAKHTPIVNVCRRLSRYPCKQVTNEIGILIKAELILPYKTHHGNDIRLNPGKMKEIKELTKSKWDKFKKI